MSIPIKKRKSDYDQFVYRVSHDLQEPARGIKSFLMLLEKSSAERLDGSGQLYLKKAREQADHLQDMLKDLLLLSRVGRASEENSEVEIAPLIDKFKQRHASNLARDKWESTLPADFTLAGQGKEIVQLFSVIFDNWAKHSPDAHLSISLKKSKSYQTVAIAHTGVQMPSTVMRQIFDMFYTTRRQDGYRGAGLAMAKAIVENLGGYVETKGAETNTFTLYLHFPT